MKILLLSKRQYTGKDLLHDKYGRLFEIPKELAQLGHEVTGVCLSYRQRNEGQIYGPEIDGSRVNWYSWNLGKIFLPGIIHYIWKLNKIIEEFKPDSILASSDAIHIIIGQICSKLYKVPLIVDLYDNYESFRLTRIPGVKQLFRSAVANADGVVCVSRKLLEYARLNYSPKGRVVVVENGIPDNIFKKLDKTECRAKFELPIDGKIIGTAGALAKNRGIDLLFEVFRTLSTSEDNLYLALAGPIGRGVDLPSMKKVYYMGELAHKQVPEFLNCLDVAVVCNRLTPFGEYCYPQKIAEILACKIPVVAANTSDMEFLFVEDQESIYLPGDFDSLKRAILEKLESRVTKNIEPHTWGKLAKKLDVFLRR